MSLTALRKVSQDRHSIINSPIQCSVLAVSTLPPTNNFTSACSESANGSYGECRIIDWDSCIRMNLTRQKTSESVHACTTYDPILHHGSAFAHMWARLVSRSGV